MSTEKSEDSKSESKEPPGHGRPPHPWEGVTDAQWNDWRWQLSHRLKTADDFAQVLRLTPEEIEGLSAPGRFRVHVTPYFASLMDPRDANCPIRRQVVPTAREMAYLDAEMADSLAEEAQSPVPGLVHRYPDRVLMLVTTECASYCRFCTRSRIVGDSHTQFDSADYERQLAYIAATPEIRDVLLSGGDPLMMSQQVLEGLLQHLRAIPHVEIVRIGTRAPVFVPQRITDDLVSMLRRYHPLWVNIHFNHPDEITPDVALALARLADGGIPLGSQTVLLSGVNDCPNVILALAQKLVKNRVRPYYLYQCDLVQGAGHFRTPVAKGIEIMEALRGHTSGFAIPTFVIDAPEGGGKVPILPNYLLSMSDSQVVVRNYEGFIATYTQPVGYQAHDPATCAYCQARRDGEGQRGVAGMLAGRTSAIVPQGWRALHQRVEMELLSGNNGKDRSGLRLDVTPALGRHERPSGTPRLQVPVLGAGSKLRVGLIYNLKHHVVAQPGAPDDALAEYDSFETIQALEDALVAGGHQVVRLEADTGLLDTVRRAAPDICFNIAEGLGGDARESQVPALLEMLSIPYTGSKVLTHAISLDKAMTKRVWRDAGLPTSSFQAFPKEDEPLDPQLVFPLFVKPVREGTGMGINGESIVYDEGALRKQVRWVIETYRQPALAETYLPGREFTVGLIGNVLSPGEKRYSPVTDSKGGFYDERGFHLFPALEIDARVGAGRGLYNTLAKSYVPGEDGAPLYLCPADIPVSLENEMRQLAVAAFETIGALDVGRVDFRLGDDGRPYLLEINTLPGLNPTVSDLCIVAHADGMHYVDLINEILSLAVERYVQEGRLRNGAGLFGMLCLEEGLYDQSRLGRLP
jgi:lysine 2,3-aminomutase